MTPSISTTRSSPRGVGSSLSTAVSWVMVNTKTRSKNSSRGETRSVWPGCPSGWVTSDAGLGREAAGGHGGPQRLVVGLGLVGVGPGEPGEGPVGAVALAQVGREPGRPGGAGVALGQEGAADPGVVQPSRGSLTVSRVCWYSTTRWPWWACQAVSPWTNLATHDRLACLSWRKRTSLASLPWSRAT